MTVDKPNFNVPEYCINVLLLIIHIGMNCQQTIGHFGLDFIPYTTNKYKNMLSFLRISNESLTCEINIDISIE
jgi:hypothetical protein